MARAIPAVVEMVTTALQFEAEGRELYLTVGKRLGDQVARSVLASLAGDEESHINLILSFYKILQRQKGWPALDYDTHPAPPLAAELQVLLDATAGGLASDASVLKIYELARELEIRSKDFYTSQAQITAESELSHLLRFLASVEQTHIEALQVLVLVAQQLGNQPD
jgi:rubrerythrin